MTIRVLYGTESGNSEMIAEDVAIVLEQHGTVAVADLQDTDPGSLSPADLYIIICSTYGEGELPASAQPFVDRLVELRPQLDGVHYAIFGLGDSGYADSYSKGSEYLAARLDSLGAVRVGEYGRHDAAGFDDASEIATEWVRGIITVRAAA
ncbi:flavodoxin domain-containing protein [Herbiconiux daphne]|uniref:Flavodoxin domain-containing protein n=1 Tax=Herbiconiux daphne TaxID=2970914 RepID=A0ABT2H6U0_9MICO|nr:flavodoxin domain-containing protein [Herbiconiux daphne]MCS5735685.1 flavodoxin domain-containing protein [Herbiconiux daphne]